MYAKRGKNTERMPSAGKTWNQCQLRGESAGKHDVNTGEKKRNKKNNNNNQIQPTTSAEEKLEVKIASHSRFVYSVQLQGEY